MHYNMEVINNLNIEFVFIVVNITKYPTHIDAGILLLNSNPDSYCCPGCAEQAQNWFLNSLRIKSPQKADLRKALRNSVV